MSLSKKDKLVQSLEALERKELDTLSRTIAKRDLSKEPDLDMTLTKIIVLEVITPYPDIMQDKKSEKLRLFSQKEIRAAKPSTPLRLSPKEVKAAMRFFGDDVPTLEKSMSPKMTLKRK